MTVATIRPSNFAIWADDSPTSHDLWNGADGTPVAFQLGTFALPAGAVTMRTRVRFRVVNGTAGLGNSSTVTINIGSQSLVTPNLGSVELATVTGAWHTTVGLTQSDIDGASGIAARDGGLPRVHELYVDIEYVTGATVAMANVTSPSMTPTPTYTGTATVDPDSDTGDQVAVQVKVFTAAQVAAGGFNPATSTPVWDSDVVYTTTTAVTQEAGYLVTGVTYHPYMRVAQYVAGVLSWSPWDAPASPTFTLDASLAPATVNTVTVAANGANGTVDVTVNRNTGGIAWTSVIVARSVDGGATWTTFATDEAPGADSTVVEDHLAPSGTDILYRARASASNGSLSPWVEAAAPVTWSPAEAWMKSAASADLSTAVDILEGVDWEHEWANGWAAPSGSPYVIGGHDVMSGRRGVLTLRCTEAEVSGVLTVLAVSPVVLFQFPTTWGLGGDLWAVVSSVRRRRPAQSFLVDLTVTETTEPT